MAPRPSAWMNGKNLEPRCAARIDCAPSAGPTTTGTWLAKAKRMSTQTTVRKIDARPQDMQWTRAGKQLDAVAAALFAGDLLRAMQLARVATRELDELAAHDAEAQR